MLGHEVVISTSVPHLRKQMAAAGIVCVCVSVCVCVCVSNVLVCCFSVSVSVSCVHTCSCINNMYTWVKVTSFM